MQSVTEESKRLHYVDILARQRQRINSSFQDIPECLDLSFDPGVRLLILTLFDLFYVISRCNFVVLFFQRGCVGLFQYV